MQRGCSAFILSHLHVVLISHSERFTSGIVDVSPVPFTRPPSPSRPQQFILPSHVNPLLSRLPRRRMPWKGVGEAVLSFRAAAVDL